MRTRTLARVEFGGSDTQPYATLASWRMKLVLRCIVHLSPSVSPPLLLTPRMLHALRRCDTQHEQFIRTVAAVAVEGSVVRCICALWGVGLGLDSNQSGAGARPRT